MLDLIRREPAVGVHQDADAAREGSGYRDLGSVQDGYLVPPIGLGSTGGKGRDQILSDRENGAHDIERIDAIGFHQRAQELVGCAQDLLGTILFDGSGATEPTEAKRQRLGHGAESSESPATDARHR